MEIGVGLKIKIIRSNDSEDLERRVNEFIHHKEVIDIKYQSFFVPTKYSNGMISNADIYDRAMIIYKEEVFE